MPRDLPDALPSHTIEGDAAQMLKVLNWQREIIAGLRSGLKETAPPEPVTSPKDPSDTATEGDLERTTNVINWLKEDAARPDSSQGTPPAKKIG
jgi:hypothetical protein